MGVWFYGYINKDNNADYTGTFSQVYAWVKDTPQWRIRRVTTSLLEGKPDHIRSTAVTIAQSRTDEPGTMAAWYKAQQDVK